ncbi:GDP-L-fucose synthase family protein [Noviherbaspirillum sp.]|uniref:GDP-L-fucose synthase family protein n=1 Tax=Noviherbaspirillum sp. TaxID=1926288 RepID=UPI002FE28DBE
MPSQRILLTGGRGMVGQNVLEHPSIGDFEVIAPTRAELDLRNFDQVQHFFDEHKPDLVIHAAGKVGGIQANIREPVSFLLENLDIGRNVVWAARRAGVRRLINLGSSCMYPRNRRDALREEMVLTGELEPTNEGYALAKVVTARLCEYVSREDGDYRYKTLIPCNLYGRYDKFDPQHSHLVPAIIHKVHLAKTQGLDEVEIWGDGMARREFMYSGDVADVLVEASRRFDDLPLLMNVGLGRDYFINEYYRVAADVIGYRGRFVHNLDRPTGMARKLVDVCRQKEWGWTPGTDLVTGIEKTYQYYLEEIVA